MLIACSCPECDYRFHIAAELAGKSRHCPKCGTRFRPEGTPQAPTRRAEEDRDDEGESNGQEGISAERKGIPQWAYAVFIPVAKKTG
jgi:hypothetical protein